MTAIMGFDSHAYSANECWERYEEMQDLAERFGREGNDEYADWAFAASLVWERKALDAHWQNVEGRKL